MVFCTSRVVVLAGRDVREVFKTSEGRALGVTRAHGQERMRQQHYSTPPWQEKKSKREGRGALEKKVIKKRENKKEKKSPVRAGMACTSQFVSLLLRLVFVKQG
ncbi:hypothetical protein D6783_04755 [Candidatus Woesearchaeota archaeon]|nr:MAG: hypothetical protein D6783_04755 [Candidatus Woesearchaeota archaeon]